MEKFTRVIKNNLYTLDGLAVGWEFMAMVIMFMKVVG